MGFKTNMSWMILKGKPSSGREHRSWAFRKVVHFFCSTRSPPLSPWMDMHIIQYHIKALRYSCKLECLSILTAAKGVLIIQWWELTEFKGIGFHMLVMLRQVTHLKEAQSLTLLRLKSDFSWRGCSWEGGCHSIRLGCFQKTAVRRLETYQLTASKCSASFPMYTCSWDEGDSSMKAKSLVPAFGAHWTYYMQSKEQT